MILNRKNIYRVIFESDTRGGQLFDLLLIITIVLSVTTVMLSSVSHLQSAWQSHWVFLEWFFTILFSIEYLLRIYCTPKRLKYITSFLGLVDLAAILPTYIAFVAAADLGVFAASEGTFLMLRLLRVVRIFRILKLVQFIHEADALMLSLKRSFRKIVVFLLVVTVLVTLMGALIYLVEGEENGFTSIPISIYWAIVTLTTVGYGDLSPKTPPGQAISALVMILGYAIIAVPTGIVSVEWKRQTEFGNQLHCPICQAANNPPDSHFCATCGHRLDNKYVEPA